MHGIQKAKLTDAEKDAKTKERAKKLQIFVSVRDKIFEKIRNGIFDEEGLKLTGQLLSANPDIYTFWNYRKKALNKILSIDAAEQSDLVCRNELELTENCLRKNPKSYGAWHHRGWILARMKQPNFDAELKQCEQALSIDERNFHCWDHMRIVCKLANLSNERQLSLTDKKVKENFSNYSAWHYRSTLLPSIFPDQSASKLSVDETKLVAELQIVHNAFFTDPDDQSSWFYRNWLLKSLPSKKYVRAELIKFYVDKRFGTFFVYFSSPIVFADLEFQVIVKNLALAGLQWTSADGSRCSRVWKCEFGSFDVGTAIKVVSKRFTAIEMNFPTSSGEEMFVWSNSNAIADLLSFEPHLSDELKKCLEIDLKNTSELSDLEKDKKWPLLTSLATMRSLDFKRYETKIFEGLALLSKLDVVRRGVYEDLASKWRIEKVLHDFVGSNSCMELKGLNLTVFYHADLMTDVTSLNLSNNRISDLRPLVYLIELRKLKLASNRVVSLNGVQHLKRLQKLDVSTNAIENFEQLPSLVKCPLLKVVKLSNNPVAQLRSKDELTKKLQLGSSCELVL